MKSRRGVLAASATVSAAALAGCASRLPGVGAGDDDDVPTTTTKQFDDSDTYVGMVYATGGLGDDSFNDMANRGIKRSRVEYGVEYKNEVPASPDEMQDLQSGYAASSNPDFDLAVCVGFLQTDPLKQTAKAHDDQRFMLIDSVVDRDNVANYVFKEHEGSFLVGHLSALLSTREFAAGAGRTNPDATTVGFVGGIESGLIKKFEAGFRAGVDQVDEPVDVQTTYVGAFDDVEGGKEAAAKMYDDGADVVYHAAGGTGLGVFQAAQERGRFAMGVDSDQSESDPRYANVIPASMVKRVDTAVFQAVGNVVDGAFQGGSVNSLGLAENGVELVYGSSLGGEIPGDVVDAVAASREGIVNGDISVPTTPEGN
ncbi:BMP family lipoprotein [Halorubellus salinus]|uniref:BMP family lipoprotein n=1 Tax=Halorubellus salinus TaxID=755309 RepID=UPI001D097B07|nr:BMP family protein [Halorubellus salinus]